MQLDTMSAWLLVVMVWIALGVLVYSCINRTSRAKMWYKISGFCRAHGDALILIEVKSNRYTRELTDGNQSF